MIASPWGYPPVARSCPALGRSTRYLAKHMKRLMDLLLTVIAAIILLPVAALVALAVRLTSRGPALYWSDRIGHNEQIFRMPKFRTMNVGTPAVATHLMRDPRAALTPVGGFLRRTSLDEIPQLWSVFTGDMSMVGPRPALFNQDDLVLLRRSAGVNALRPGITGWAQVNGRDELPIPIKVEFDREYLERQSLLFDLGIILRTAGKLLGDKTVTH
jgi:O-antigen biosynthesis protein WbqP